MARIGDGMKVDVPCPECGDAIEVPIRVTSQEIEDGTLQVSFTPDLDQMAAHYAVEHCGAEVAEPS